MDQPREEEDCNRIHVVSTINSMASLEEFLKAQGNSNRSSQKYPMLKMT